MGDFILSLPTSETIKVRFCYNLEELFHLKKPLSVYLIVLKLQILELKSLPNLKKNLCRPKESWPSLEQVDVVACDLLMKLPLTLENINTIKEIRGGSLGGTDWKWIIEPKRNAFQRLFLPEFCEDDKYPSEKDFGRSFYEDIRINLGQMMRVVSLSSRSRLHYSEPALQYKPSLMLVFSPNSSPSFSSIQQILSKESEKHSVREKVYDVCLCFFPYS
ncbi:hypothetical protein L484_022744 [Morus notabilis]|uniref:Uncharacterized protein n=1 Tax=Morus notabilis TaxID=981085 RepID=W9SCJ6_9ROSA|nr:hypothetical protein L484_022744 [Morus notabilis]